LFAGPHKAVRLTVLILKGVSAVNDSVAKINAAVRECLEQCYAAPQPLGAMASFLVNLSGKPGWEQEEIDAVETGVMRMLAALSSPSDSGIIPSGVLSDADHRE
jgi:hypothetical protein